MFKEWRLIIANVMKMFSHYNIQDKIISYQPSYMSVVLARGVDLSNMEIIRYMYLYINVRSTRGVVVKPLAKIVNQGSWVRS